MAGASARSRRLVLGLVFLTLAALGLLLVFWSPGARSSKAAGLSNAASQGAAAAASMDLPEPPEVVEEPGRDGQAAPDARIPLDSIVDGQEAPQTLRTVDLQGDPVEKVWVLMGIGKTFDSLGHTDADGRLTFELPGPETESYSLLFRPDVHIPTELELVRSPPGDVITVQLELWSYIRGQVLTVEGLPAPEIRVEALDASQPLLASRGSRTWSRRVPKGGAVTDESGRFAIEQLAPGTYHNLIAGGDGQMAGPLHDLPPYTADLVLVLEPCFGGLLELREPVVKSSPEDETAHFFRGFRPEMLAGLTDGARISCAVLEPGFEFLSRRHEDLILDPSDRDSQSHHHAKLVLLRDLRGRDGSLEPTLRWSIEVLGYEPRAVEFKAPRLDPRITTRVVELTPR